MKLLNDRELTQGMAQKAYTFRKNELSINKMMSRTLAIYREVLNDSCV